MTDFFRYYRNGFGLRQSFALATGKEFIPWLADRVAELVIIAILVLGVYGFFAWVDGRVITARAEQQTYIEGLEKVVAQCLSDATGKPVVIGGEIYLCGIVPTGSRI